MSAKGRSDIVLQALAGYFRLLSEPARLKILHSLTRSEKSVMEIVAETGLRQAHTSRQLAVLANAGLLARRKEGTRVFYSLTDSHLIRILDDAEGSLREHLHARLSDLK